MTIQFAIDNVEDMVIDTILENKDNMLLESMVNGVERLS
jgi:hypothetical protein